VDRRKCPEAYPGVPRKEPHGLRGGYVDFAVGDHKIASVTCHALEKANCGNPKKFQFLRKFNILRQPYNRRKQG
jgi:hypothetical protein